MYKLIFRLLKLIFEPIKTFFLKSIALNSRVLNNQKQFEKMHLFYHYIHGNMSNFLHFVDKLQLLEASFEGINCLKASHWLLSSCISKSKFPTPYFHENLDWSILKVRQSQNVFSSRCFFQKTKERILIYYNETAGPLVFVCCLEEIEDTKKTFRN